MTERAAALPGREREVLGERGPAVRPGLGRFDRGRHPQHAYVVASRASVIPAQAEPRAWGVDSRVKHENDGGAARE